MILDLAVSLGSMLIAPAFDFLKSKFVKKKDRSPDQVIGDLASMKPEALAGYMDALARYQAAEVQFYNRDVIGTPAQWVITLRSAIRPLSVVAGMLCLSASLLGAPALDPGARLFFEGIIGSWFGSRLSSK